MAEDKDGYIRAFVAIDFPVQIKSIVASTISQLKGVRGDVTWVKPKNIHLTLKFLGKISAAQIIQVKAAINTSISDIHPFNLQLTELGVFPNKNRPRVIWWGINNDTPVFIKLYHNLEKKLAACGFPCEKRKFTPHLTLGRIRKLSHPQELITLISKAELPAVPPVKINRLGLFQSTLTGTGAIYKQLASFPFGKNELN